MPVLDAQGNPIETQPKEPQAPASQSSDSDNKPVTPAFATAEDLATRDAKMGELAETMAEMRGVLQGIASRGGEPQPQQPAAIPEITAEQLNEVLRNADDGNPGAAIKSLVDSTVVGAAERLVRDHLQPLQQYGVMNFATMAEQSVAALPDYKRFEKEIKKEMDTLTRGQDHLKGMTSMWKSVYELVKGRHADELANEAAEQAVRQARESGQFSNTPGNEPTEPPKLSTGEPVPTAKDLGAEAEAALRYKKVDQERMASSLGYESWQQLQEQMALKDPYEDDSFLFPKGKRRGPSFRGASRA